MKITETVPAVFAALTMKTIITSNWWARRRGLCTLLLCNAALWAMPRNAHAQPAQLYVVQQLPQMVGEYDATTGAPNPNFTVINLPLNFTPYGIALSGNDLFVSVDGFANAVMEFDATTGAAINATETDGVTLPSGTFTVTFPTPFSQIPNLTVQGPATVVSVTTTGFVVEVDTRLKLQSIGRPLVVMAA